MQRGRTDELGARVGALLAAALLLLAALTDRDALALLAAAGAGSVLWRFWWVSARRAAQRKRVFERAFDAAPHGMLLMSVEPATRGRVVGANQALGTMVGLAPEEVVRRGWPAITHPDEPGGADELVGTLLAGDIETTEVERRLVHAGGREVTARVRTVLVGDEEGRPLWSVSHVEDVTAAVRAEAALATQQVVSEVLGSAAGLDEVLPEVLVLLSTRLALRRAVLWTLEPDVDALVARGGWPGTAVRAGAERRRGEGAVGRAWQRGSAEPGAVPLGAGGEVLGVLEYDHVPGYAPEPEDSELLAALARQLGLFVDRLHRVDQVAGLAHAAATDPLTGLPNRRGWEQALPRELARAGRRDEALCLAVLDLDHFKAFNDAHGHPAGDRLLHDCARRWSEVLRRTDLLARYGGEEFILVLPDCELGAAAELLERVRAATPDGQTCSVGLARWRPGEQGAELVRRADEALYVAKRGGRNKLVAAEELLGV